MDKAAQGVAGAVVAAGIIGVLAAGVPAQAQAFEHSDELHINMGIMPCTFTNAEGQVLEVYDANAGTEKKAKYKDRGDMAYDGFPEWEDGSWTAGYDIPWTRKLVYEQPSGDWAGIGSMQIYDHAMDQGGAFINQLHAKKMTVSIGDDGQLKVSAPDTGEGGEKARFSVDIGGYGKGWLIDFEGAAKGDLTFGSLAKGAYVKGASGLSVITGPKGQQRWYLHGKGRHTVKLKGKKISKVTDASRISDKTTKHKHVCGLKAKSADAGKRAFATWKMPRKAKSYRVWRKDGKSKKWKKAALRKGRDANWWCGKLKSGKACRLKVRAYKDKKGKKALGKASYSVKVVGEKDPHRANAAKVVLYEHDYWASYWHWKPVGDKTAGHVGGWLDLSPEPSAADSADERDLVSYDVRWYTSDASVAAFDGKKDGRLRFVGPGKCEVWAKAHDGVNSKKLKVTVKKA